MFKFSCISCLLNAENDLLSMMQLSEYFEFQDQLLERQEYLFEKQFSERKKKAQAEQRQDEPIVILS